MEQLITVATFNERDPGDRIVTRLREAGVDAEIYDESLEQKWKLLNFKPKAHIRVRVHTRDEDAALKRIAEWKDGPEMTRAVHCPECGSSQVEFPQFSRRTIMGAWPAVLASAGVIEPDYYCQSCQFTWPAEPPKVGPEVDALNWPKR
jgi:hypothetical protein